MLNFVVISGSGRPQSESARVGEYIRQRLIDLQLSDDSNCSLIDLGTSPLPLWPERNDGLWHDYATRLQAANALIVITPEWHGMASPALKNLFILASKEELAHKPALLVGVSSGLGGSYPISELRSSSFKNNRLCYIPEQLIVRHVNSMLHPDPVIDDNDRRLRPRIDYALGVLGHYATALRTVQAAVDMSNSEFANGM
ncbi:NADPH-dependent FMN reductase [Denitrificimonas caeni]|uniref:NADPH-dependent FMN reductase n=1 Tax=Denitrificimonas caeni TaxID=521720 RepID=UPI001962939C|nr:NAD(P)H-dependent oxidoreductase [Denitrificimonas caeni]